MQQQQRCEQQQQQQHQQPPEKAAARSDNKNQVRTYTKNSLFHNILFSQTSVL